MYGLKKLAVAWLGFTLLYAGAGCARRDSTPVRFYLLQPMTAPAPGGLKATESALRIDLGPIKFPEYLDRPQIIRAISPAQMRLNEFERWAEPLKINFLNVLTENLTLLMPSAQLAVHPWRRSPDPTYQVTVEVASFHAAPSGEAQLQAKWMILKNHQVVLQRNSKIVAPAKAGDYEAMVLAMSQAVAALSREIAGSIRTIEGQ